MENQNQVDSFFNPQTEINVPTPDGNATEYRPTAAKGTNNVYQAIIRFIPWYEDAQHGSIREKWSCWLVDPLTEKGRSVDCPSSIGQPSVLQDMYFKCKNSDNAVLNSKKDVFSRRRSFASLIQVIKDQHNPELEGKILVWKYGVKIHEKIDAMLKPMIGEKDDPFDILQGKAFALIITKVSGYNNYDQSKFLDNKAIPLLMPDATGKLAPISATTDRQAVFNFVKENSPDLSAYDFQPWDQATHDYVNNVILQVTGESVGPSNYAAASNAKTADGAGSSVDSGITSTDLNLGGGTNESANADPLAGLDLPDLSGGNVGGASGGGSNSGIPGNLDDALAGL